MMINISEQNQLRQKFNPDGSLLRQHQLRMLEMLRYIDEVCKKHDIKYWLSSGTLLGAVRHGGFIPWDDDLDVEMLKEDFEKFVNVMMQEENENYTLQIHKTDSNYFAPYGKMRDLHSYLKEVNTNDLHYKYHGIYIDIFVLEPSSSYWLTRLSSGIQGKAFYSMNTIKLEIWRKMITECFYSIIYDFIFPCLSFFSKIGAKTQLRHVHGSCFLRPRYSTDIFPLEKLEFEGTLFPVPWNYDSCLRNIYGDYMKLPDLDKIENHVTTIEFYE